MNLIKQSLLLWGHPAIDSYKKVRWWHENLEIWKFLYFGSKKPRNSADTVTMDVTACLKEATILPWEVMVNLLTILIEPASISSNVTNVFWMNMQMGKVCQRIHQNHLTVSIYFHINQGLLNGMIQTLFKMMVAAKEKIWVINSISW